MVIVRNQIVIISNFIGVNMKQNLRILFGGDYYPYKEIGEYVKKENKSSEIFGDLQKYINSVDFSIINLEFPAITNISKCAKIVKIGPNLKGRIIDIKPIIDSNINVISLGNNHTLDYGWEGISQTKKYLESNDKRCIGLSDNSNNLKFEEFSKDDLKIGIINVVESEFNLATDNHGGAIPIDPIDIYHLCEKEKNKYDHIIMIFHGGQDFCYFPPPFMKKYLRFFIDIGFSAIICHHSHLISGYEVYAGAPIFYGLGNLIYTTVMSKESNETFAVELNITKEKIDWSIVPLYFDRKKMKLIEKYSVKNKIEELSKIISNDALSKEKWQEFFSTYWEVNYLSILYGHNVYFWKFLKKMRLLRLYKRYFDIFNFRKIPVMNLIRRETHRDALLYLLKKHYDNKN